MDNLIQISKINDFIFCPHSLYLHTVFDGFNSKTYHQESQTKGKLAHQIIDNRLYSTSANWWQGKTVCSNQYGLVGKIDLFNTQTGELVERKYLLQRVYVGYKYQLYAQMLCLQEMGKKVNKLKIHSLSDNRQHSIALPTKLEIMKFIDIINQIRHYNLSESKVVDDRKCAKCIYATLCTLTQTNADTT